MIDREEYDDDRTDDDVWCEACGKPCSIQVVDYGIGAYEYWGAPGFDIQLCEVSDCCEAEPLDFPPVTDPPNPDHIPEDEVA